MEASAALEREERDYEPAPPLTAAGMFARVARGDREARAEHRARGEEEERREREEETEEWIPEEGGVADLCLRQIEASRKLRESCGFSGAARGAGFTLAEPGAEDGVERVPLSHFEAHERFLEEGRELRESVERSLARARAVGGC